MRVTIYPQASTNPYATEPLRIGRTTGSYRRAAQRDTIPSVYIAVRWTSENMPRGNWSAVMNRDERTTPSASLPCHTASHAAIPVVKQESLLRGEQNYGKPRR